MPINKIPRISLDLFKKKNINSLSLLYCTTQSSSRFSAGLWSSNCSGNPQTDSSKHWLTDLNHPRRRPSCSLVSCGWCSYRAGEVVVVVEEAIGDGHITHLDLWIYSVSPATFVKEIQILLALVETYDVCSWNIPFLLCLLWIKYQT